MKEFIAGVVGTAIVVVVTILSVLLVALVLSPDDNDYECKTAYYQMQSALT